MHVHNGDMDKVSGEVYEEFERARRHYETERDGADGVTVEVV